MLIRKNVNNDKDSPIQFELNWNFRYPQSVSSFKKAVGFLFLLTFLCSVEATLLPQKFRAIRPLEAVLLITLAAENNGISGYTVSGLSQMIQ